MNDGNGNVRALERRDALLKWARRLGCFALCVILAFGSLRLYDDWRQQHLAQQVEQFAARGDYQNAVLVARRLLQLDENNLAACRAMAEMAEKAGRADAITWRRKIAHLQPRDTASQLAFARSAVGFGETLLAERILNSIPQDARATVEYHQLAGAAALAKQDRATAEAHFAIAVQLAPNDTQAALNLAVLRLVSPNRDVAEQARAVLAALASQPAARVEALRALTAAALGRNESAAAAKWARQLDAEQGATFADSILCFHALQNTDAAPGALVALQTRAATSPEKATALITWLNRNGMAQAAIEWHSSLPAKIRETQPLPLALAESLSFLQDWSGLRAWVQGKNWGACESLRLAVESHALHRLSPPGKPSMESQVAWSSALKTAQLHPEQLVAIAQLAEGWGYDTESEEAWWQIANSNQNTGPALAALQRQYQEKKDTRGLWRVAKRALQLNPEDLVAANNCASFGLLLSGDNTSRRLALKLHTEYPTNRAFTATYAYALQTESRGAEGLKLLESLKESELQYPSIAAYYVVLLVENGNLERARSFLVHAKRAVLLPEEQALLDAATRKLLPVGPEALVAR